MRCRYQVPFLMVTGGILKSLFSAARIGSEEPMPFSCDLSFMSSYILRGHSPFFITALFSIVVAQVAGCTSSCKLPVVSGLAGGVDTNGCGMDLHG